MSEGVPTSHEEETAAYSAFRVNIEGRISAWEENKQSGIKGVQILSERMN